MTHVGIASFLRGKLIAKTHDEMYADCVMAASDTHIIKSYIRREGHRRYHHATPAEIDSLIADCVNGCEFVKRVTSLDYGLPRAPRDDDE